MDLELFLADLAGRFDAHRRDEVDALVGELTDAERAGVTFSSRMVAMRGTELTVLVRGGERLTGEVVDVAESWVLLRTRGGDSLVPTAAVVAAWPMGGAVAGGIGLGDTVGLDHVLREAADQGLGVVIDHDAGLHQGVVGAVLADHFDLEPDPGATAGDLRHRSGGVAVVSLSLAGVRRIRLMGMLA